MSASGEVVQPHIAKDGAQGEEDHLRQCDQPVSDRDLDATLRRFQKQVQHVHICPAFRGNSFPPGLDLNSSVNEEFSVVKLRNNLERLGASFGMGLLRAGLEIHMLRSWVEAEKTGLALLVYSFAWFFHVILTTLCVFGLLVALFPEFRKACFPISTTISPTPWAFTAAGRPKLPMMSLSPPTASAASYAWGVTAAEAKAVEWVNTGMDLLRALVEPENGKPPKQKEERISRTVNEVVVKDMGIIAGSGDSKEDDGQEKSSRDDTLDTFGKPVMRLVGSLADKWERLANNLTESTPLHVRLYRLRRLVWLAVPIVFASIFVSDRVISQMVGALFGFLIFGKPLLDRLDAQLECRIPHWKQRLVMENHLLPDGPTNAQVVLKMLREAEEERQPLPAPSSDAVPLGMNGVVSSGNENASAKGHKAEMKQIMEKTQDGARAWMRRTWDKAGSLKEETFALVTGHKFIGSGTKAAAVVDRLHLDPNGKAAKLINSHSNDDKTRDRDSRELNHAYTAYFPGFYVHHVKHGPGHILIHPPSTSSRLSDDYTPARVSFTTIRGVTASNNISIDPHSEPESGHLVVSINDVIGLKKEGMGLPGRILTSLALDVEGAGSTGLEIRIIRREPPNKDGSREVQGKEEIISLRSVVRRDELFTRLISLGEQKWEMI